MTVVFIGGAGSERRNHGRSGVIGTSHVGGRGANDLPILNRQFGLQSLRSNATLRASEATRIDGSGGDMRYERGHIRIDARALSDRRYILMHMLEYERHRIIRSERHLSGQHFPMP